MNDSQLINEVVRTLKLEGEAISDLAQTISTSSGLAAQQWLLAIRLLNAALEKNGKIVVTGVGKSGKIAQKISATLSSTGSFSVFLHPTEGLHGDLGYVQANDVVLALSYTGNTEELLRILPTFKERKIPVIAITGNPKSQLGTQSNAILNASVKEEACPHKLAPTTSSTLALAVGDALSIALMRLRGFDSESFAKNHPGGSLGRKLHLTVAEVMHQGDEVAMVYGETPMDQVIIASTQKKLGAVAVCDGKTQKLLGIITDGDIRRALSHREKFFALKANEVMSSSPITASPEMMANEALALMQNRPSQISVLPVINPNNEFLGLIRLHDIIQTF